MGSDPESDERLKSARQLLLVGIASVVVGTCAVLLACVLLASLSCRNKTSSIAGDGNRLGVKHSGKVLTESIGVETLGGVFTVVIKKGTECPVTVKEVFSTAEDNQAAVDIHVLRGNAKLAKDNRTLGRFQVHGIPSAPRGVPQIDVSFILDREGNLEVKARDKATGREKQVRVLGLETTPK